MSEALINIQVLEWAIKRYGHEPEKFTDKLADWLDGKKKPTFKQAQDLAKVLHIPFGYLYLSKPPVEKLSIPDLRTLKDSAISELSTELRDVITDALSKQDWYRDYLIENAEEPLPFIKKYSVNTPIENIANDIIATLKLNIEERQGYRNWEEFFRALIHKAEDAGILVLCNGKVGFNTRRILDVEEFRGFAITDKFAPLVFINGTDAKAAQIFTLIHELVHLWIGESCISDLSVIPAPDDTGRKMELICNAVAAEVLVPIMQLQERWNRNLSLEQNSDTLRRDFKVSPIVIARRALDSGLISRNEFFDFYNTQKKRWKNKQSVSGGGNFHNSFPIANSSTFTHRVLREVYSGKLLMRDGARLLNTKPATLDKYAKQGGLF